jgi:hypothetical protein
MFIFNIFFGGWLRLPGLRPERRAGIGDQGGWFWVYFASVLSILGLVGVLVIWLLRRQARKKACS